MESSLLEILVCPLCKGKLSFNEKKQQLICRFDRLAYPVEDDIPVMLIDRAIKLTSEEIES